MKGKKKVNLITHQHSTKMSMEEHNKKQQQENLEKLKQVLAHHLWQHKMLIKSALPFDSSSNSFAHDLETLHYDLEEIKE